MVVHEPFAGARNIGDALHADRRSTLIAQDRDRRVKQPADGRPAAPRARRWARDHNVLFSSGAGASTT
jgi:hypothetical protein